MSDTRKVSKRLILILVGELFAIAVIVVVARFALSGHAPVRHSGLSMASVTLVFFACILPLILHEADHVLGGLINGMRFTAMIVGPMKVTQDDMNGGHVSF